MLGREPVKLELNKIALYLKNVVLVTGGGGSTPELCRQIAASFQAAILLDFNENNAYDIQNELKFKYPDLNLTAVIANIREEQRSIIYQAILS